MTNPSDLHGGNMPSHQFVETMESLRDEDVDLALAENPNRILKQSESHDPLLKGDEPDVITRHLKLTHL